MGKYTTGELAKLCNVSVRTVQYYDNRGILMPSELSEGGRRLYSEEDLKKMKIICFLRELELPIESIKKIFSEENFEEVFVAMLEVREQELQGELSEKQKQVQILSDMKKNLGRMSQISADSIGDVAELLKNKPRLRRLRLKLLLMGLGIELIEWGGAILWALTGVWIPFAVGLVLGVILAILLSRCYFNGVSYLCPDCHSVFVPSFREAFFANHTPNTRKLTCTHCGHHGFCVETCRKNKQKESREC